MINRVGRSSFGAFIRSPFGVRGVGGDKIDICVFRASSFDNIVRFLDPETYTLKSSFSIASYAGTEPFGMGFDGTYVWLIERRQGVGNQQYVYKIAANGSLLATINTHQDTTSGPTGKTAASMGIDNSASVSSGNLLIPYNLGAGNGSFLDILSYSGSYIGTYTVYATDARTFNCISKFNSKVYFVISSSPTTVIVYDTGTNSIVNSGIPRASNIVGVSAISSSELLVSFSDSRIAIVDASTLSVLSLSSVSGVRRGTLGGGFIPA